MEAESATSDLCVLESPLFRLSSERVPCTRHFGMCNVRCPAFLTYGLLGKRTYQMRQIVYSGIFRTNGLGVQFNQKGQVMGKNWKTTEDIPFSCEELFKVVSSVVKDMNMFMLPPEITSTRRVGRFYCEGIKGLKYAVQIEAIGGLQKSKLIIKAFAPNQESLIGFYHKILDEIQERVSIKDYIKEPLIIKGDYVVSKKEIKDSVIYKSDIK